MLHVRGTTDLHNTCEDEVGACDLTRITVTENGIYMPDEEDGYYQVDVNVPNTYTESDEGKVVDDGALVVQGSQAYTANGNYDTTLINDVTVNVSGGSSTLITKTITANGTYDATDDNADGYSQVTVNVSGGGTSGVKIMEQGQVSTTSDYATATFDGGVDLTDYQVLKTDMWRGGVIVGSSYIIMSSLPTTFTIVGGGYTYSMSLTATTIKCTHYSGAYVNLYVDVYGYILN